MSKGANVDLERDDWPIAEEEVTTHQEAIPVPYIAGTRRVALRWVSPAVDMITIQAKDETPGKK